MITSSPSLVKAAQRAHIAQTQKLIEAYELAARTIPGTLSESIPVFEQLAERWPAEFGETLATLRKHAETERECARLRTEISAVDAWREAVKTLRGKKLLDACAALTVKHPKLFGADFETVRKIAALQIEADEARIFDVRKVGFGPADFPYHPPAPVER